MLLLSAQLVLRRCLPWLSQPKLKGASAPFFREVIMVTFRCKQSGNTVSFEHQHDIDAMKSHDGYERVEEVEEPVKKMGRPRKVNDEEVS